MKNLCIFLIIFLSTSAYASMNSLHQLALHGNHSRIKISLDSGVDRYIKNEYNKIPLDYAKAGLQAAMLDGNPKRIKSYEESIRLLEEYYPKVKDIRADSNSVEEVYSLIEKGMSLKGLKDLNLDLEMQSPIKRDSSWEWGFTLLHLASEENNTPAIQLLLEAGADKATKTPVTDKIPLHIAVLSDSMEAVKVLADEETVNVQEKFGQTSLHFASIINSHDADTGTYEKDYEIIRILIENGADVNVRNNDGEIPLHKASEGVYNPSDTTSKELQLKIAHMLLDETNINTRNNYNWTPLHVASLSEQDGIVKFLLEEGADRHIENKDGEVPLDIAKEQLDFIISSGRQEYGKIRAQQKQKALKEVIRLLEEHYPSKKNVNENPKKVPSPTHKNIKTLSKKEIKERGEVSFTSLISSSQKKKCEESMQSQTVKTKQSIK